MTESDVQGSASEQRVEPIAQRRVRYKDYFYQIRELLSGGKEKVLPIGGDVATLDDRDSLIYVTFNQDENGHYEERFIIAEDGCKGWVRGVQSEEETVSISMEELAGRIVGVWERLSSH